MKRCTKCQLEKDETDFSPSELKKKSSLCKPCAVEKSKKWAQENPDRANANKRRWKRKNPEKLGKWEEANPERVAGYKREWSRKNPEKALDSRKRWAKQNPEKVREKNKRWKNTNTKLTRFIEIVHWHLK